MWCFGFWLAVAVTIPREPEILNVEVSYSKVLLDGGFKETRKRKLAHCSFLLPLAERLSKTKGAFKVTALAQKAKGDWVPLEFEFAWERDQYKKRVRVSQEWPLDREVIIPVGRAWTYGGAEQEVVTVRVSRMSRDGKNAGKANATQRQNKTGKKSS